MIRITDNGSGINKQDIKTAFLRHATSKIKTAVDLLSVSSLGFRGEALSSIAAVSQVELITKKAHSLIGTRYVIDGAKEKLMEDVGCPTGTTIIIRNLFYNTPARKKFLKPPASEASLISELMERLILSHPNISFKYINNSKVLLQSTGNNNSKDIIYQTFGRELAKDIIKVNYDSKDLKVNGFIGKPNINKGNRNYEIYFINGRYIKSSIITKAIEDAYKPYLMQRRFPFTSLYIDINPQRIDVNVHPQKLEVRITNEEEVYNIIVNLISDSLSKRELIPSIKLVEKKEEKKKIEKKNYIAEPFETKRKEEQVPILGEQRTLFQETEDSPHIFVENFHNHKIIGQVFSTYWLVEFNNELFYIDQHAAHEKILYEQLIKSSQNKEVTSQMLFPPIIISLTRSEKETINTYMNELLKFGYEIDDFAGNDLSIRAVPYGLYGLSEFDLLKEVIDNLTSELNKTKPELILEKIASISCKSAIKANKNLSYEEAKKLIEDLLLLNNPYHCPHGRPIIISMTKYELEKKFKRIV